MEDFIYILLIFAWIGYSFYKVSKKKAEQAKPKSVQNPIESSERNAPAHNNNELSQQAQQFFQQFLQSDSSQNAFSFDDKLEEEEGKSQEEFTTTSASSITTIEYRQDTFTSIEDTTAFSAHHTPEELKETPIQTSYFENEPFDFQKAIVYQAILENPYIPRYY